MLHNGLGRYDEALKAAGSALDREDLISHGRGLAELVEAAVRAGRPDEAAEALDRLARAHAGERNRLGARGRGTLRARW